MHKLRRRKHVGRSVLLATSLLHLAIFPLPLHTAMTIRCAVIASKRAPARSKCLEQWQRAVLYSGNPDRAWTCNVMRLTHSAFTTKPLQAPPLDARQQQRRRWLSEQHFLLMMPFVGMFYSFDSCARLS